MRLANALIVILFILILSSSGYSEAGVERNFAMTMTGTSQSPWLERVMENYRHEHRHLPSHPHPVRPPGCRSMPWICREGEHLPKARMWCCKNQCVDVSSDVNNCGLCGIRCPFTWQCCRGFCVDTKINPFNCGKCGNKCPCGVPCIFGMCGYSEPSPLRPCHHHHHPSPSTIPTI